MAKYTLSLKARDETKTVEANGFKIEPPLIVFYDGDTQVYAVALDLVFSIEREGQQHG